MDKKKRTGGIRSRLLICMISFTAMTLAVIWICQNFFLEPIYRENKIREIQQAADEIVKYADTDGLRDAVFETAKKYGVCIIVDSKGNTFENISVDVTKDCVIHRMNSWDLAKLYEEASESESGMLFFPDKGKEREDRSRLILVREVPHRSDTAIIMINTVIVPLGATVDTMNTMLIFVAVIMVILSIILTLILSGIITKPIVSITKSADALAKGDYSKEFKGSGYSEAHHLADTLNYAKDELRKTDELQKELITNISHDIRTPLTMISGYSQIIRDIPDENTPENLQIIIDETERLNALVTDVLDLSKLRAGTKKMNEELLSLTSLTEDALARLGKMTEGCNIAFDRADEIYIQGDRTGVLQVIYNLVANAVNHTPDSGSVSVSVRRIGNYARICVADTGEGIPREDLKGIWERYYKADSTKRSSEGSGLGLSIVKEIMLQHGGYYGVSSTVGEGSLFWVDFPIADEKAEGK